MADELIRNWEPQISRTGTFSGYSVQAIKYRSERGDVGWHTTSWPLRDPIHSFWIENGAFHSVRIYFSAYSTGRTIIEIFGIIENIDTEERNAVLEAIAEWEKP